MTRKIPLLFLVGLFLVLGCGKKEERYHISGMVTFKGVPLPSGQITFSPDSTKGNRGDHQEVVEITDGKFDTGVSGKGMAAGPVLISIDGYEKSLVNNEWGKPLFVYFTTTADVPREHTQMTFDVPADAADKMKKATAIAK